MGYLCWKYLYEVFLQLVIMLMEFEINHLSQRLLFILLGHDAEQSYSRLRSLDWLPD